MCLCSDLPSVQTRTQVVVLQHPQEFRHPFGTARFIRLCLPNSQLHTAYGGLSGDLHTPLQLPADTAVLYPHPDATDLADLPAAEHPGTLLVLDGTWSHAKRLYRMNPWLRGLRHVRLQPQEPSRYRIRKEPQADFLSTVEATVAALQILEPELRGLDGLVAAFDRMIDRQIDHAAQVQRLGRSKRPRQRPSRRLSELLAAGNLVIGYAESSLPDGDDSQPRQLVQWVAAKIDGDEVLELLLRPTAAWPRECHLDHMGLSAADLANGLSLAEAAAQFQTWAGATAPVAAWTQSSLDWAAPLFGNLQPTLSLKTQYCNLRNRRASFLEAVAAREGLQPVALQCRGRARERLGNALAAARWLRQQFQQLQSGVLP